MRYLSKLYWKIFCVFLFIILALGGIYIYIASETSVSYFEETNQRLNATVAKQIAEDTKAFQNGIVNKAEAERHFKNVMALNPAVEIYLLNKEGKILAYSAPDSAVKRSTIALEPVERFIATNGTVFLEGDNPRREDSKKAFSAARIEHKGVQEGYIYIILGGDKYESVTSGLLNRYKLKCNRHDLI